MLSTDRVYLKVGKIGEQLKLLRFLLSPVSSKTTTIARNEDRSESTGVPSSLIAVNSLLHSVA